METLTLLNRPFLWKRYMVKGFLFGVVFLWAAMGSRTQDPSTKSASMVTSVTWTACPTACFCSSLSRIVYCSRRGLVSIPGGVAPDSSQLNMNGNHFQVPVLHRSNFSTLPQLEHLYLSECGIEGIDVGTFLDLPNLKWLDLSNNRLKTLGARSFQGLNLQHLFLNGNRHFDLSRDSFVGLVTVGLYLHDCSLGWLHPAVLSPLGPSLKYLWLNGNELTTIDPQLEEIFLGLAHLRLSSNPLNCNCRLAWLKELYDSNGDTFKGAVPPSCLGPQRLRGKYFNDVSGSEFLCQSPMFNNIDANFGLVEGRLKCRASGDPAPNLYWIQPSGRTTGYHVPTGQDVRTSEATLVVNRSDAEPHLLGMYICIATNEAGNVTLTINVSWPLTHDDVLTTDLSSTTTSIALAPAQLLQGVSTKSPLVAVGKNFPRNDGEGQDEMNREDQDEWLLTNRPNYTLIRPVERTRLTDEARMFSVLQMVCAIVGSHICTLVLCLITVPVCYKSRWTRLKPRAMPIDERNVCCEKFRAPEVEIPESPSISNTGCSQFYLPDYFITSSQ